MRFDITVQLPDGDEVLAGTVAEIRIGSTRTVEFRYAPTYLDDGRAYELSPELPLTAGGHLPTVGRPMPGGLADAQPDTWGRRLIAASRRRRAAERDEPATRLSELDVLAAVPDETRHGALRVHANGKPVGEADSSVPTMVDLPGLISAAADFQEGKEVPEEALMLLEAGTSMGGARPKATVRNDRGNLALMKLPSHDDFGDAMAWEATALELSRRAGVNTPHFELTRIGYQSVLVIERFDRSGPRRVGYLSADSLLARFPGEAVDYTQFAATLLSSSANPAGDGEEMFRRVAVTLLVNNVDDHMRNHGMLRAKGGWQLSPVFDVNPFRRLGSVDSTPVSANDDPGNRDIRNLISAASSFGVDGVRAAEVIREVELATATWRAVALSFGISPEGADAMSQAFSGPNREIAKNVRVPDRPRTSGSDDAQPRTVRGQFDYKRHTPPDVTA